MHLLVVELILPQSPMSGNQTPPSPSSMGVLARFACRSTRESRRRKATLPCSVPEYKRNGDYLTHASTGDIRAHEAHAAQGVRVTRFHRGFFRAREAGSLHESTRRVNESKQEQTEHLLDEARVEQWRRDKETQRCYNILTGEGGGPADRREGVRLIPDGVNKTNEAQHRLRMGKFRFFDDSSTVKEMREKTLEREGFTNTHKESVVIGVPPAKPRLRLISVGVRDNFAHTQLRDPGKPFDAVLHRNASQIVFG